MNKSNTADYYYHDQELQLVSILVLEGEISFCRGLIIVFLPQNTNLQGTSNPLAFFLWPVTSRSTVTKEMPNSSTKFYRNVAYHAVFFHHTHSVLVISITMFFTQPKYFSFKGPPECFVHMMSTNNTVYFVLWYSNVSLRDHLISSTILCTTRGHTYVECARKCTHNASCERGKHHL